MSQKIVRIEWEDSCSDDAWQSREKALTHSPSKCRTVGFLLKKDKKEVTVAGNLSDTTTQVGMLMSIPRSCIKKITILKEVG